MNNSIFNIYTCTHFDLDLPEPPLLNSSSLMLMLISLACKSLHDSFGSFNLSGTALLKWTTKSRRDFQTACNVRSPPAMKLLFSFQWIDYCSSMFPSYRNSCAFGCNRMKAHSGIFWWNVNDIRFAMLSSAIKSWHFVQHYQLIFASGWLVILAN